MERMYEAREFDLQLFAGEGAAATPAPGTAAEADTQSEGAAEQAAPKSHNGHRRGKSGAFENVVFGKQSDTEIDTSDTYTDTDSNHADDKTTAEDSKKAKMNAFRELIKGEYKEQYTEAFQQAFNQRFKEMKGMERSLDAQKPIMDLLMQHYGIEDGDISKLQAAMDQDESYWAEEADEAGMTVEQYRKMKQLERENESFRQMRQREQANEFANRQIAQWLQEAEQMMELYPSFDFQAEVANRDFVGLLKFGIPVRQAYEVLHMDEIKAATAKIAAQRAGNQIVAKIQSKAFRPKENGMSNQGAVIVKNDVHKLSKAERAEIARRVQRGEKIWF